MRLIDADKAIEGAEHLYNLYVMSMANADTQKEINHIFKRQELFKAVRAVIEHCPTVETVKQANCGDVGIGAVKSIIANAPTIDPPAKHGKWIEVREDYLPKIYCSVCGHIAYFDCGEERYVRFAYCHNCGADMRGDS